MATILDEIVEAKKFVLAKAKTDVPLDELKHQIVDKPKPISLIDVLRGADIRLIAEIKKASPSAGLLRADFDPATLAMTYATNGAAAVSCLTDDHFQGTLEHLSAVKQALDVYTVPVLRKDFLTDPYQLFEARAYGADAALLIAAVLSADLLKELLTVATELQLQCLVEVHDEAELEAALDAGAKIIGINNRDLHTFTTDLAVTDSLAPKVPDDIIVVSESGIRERKDMVRLHKLGADAGLVGEAIMTQADPGAKVRELLGVTETFVREER
ncbi:MAG: indole-3-glycerol phosphate synthase TrpC [Chloroflexota bacterium]|nr:indole-3-glycerol phosphate synthase TrpC [Chloroflexota bacterium]